MVNLLTECTNGGYHNVQYGAFKAHLPFTHTNDDIYSASLCRHSITISQDMAPVKAELTESKTINRIISL